MIFDAVRKSIFLYSHKVPALQQCFGRLEIDRIMISIWSRILVLVGWIVWFISSPQCKPMIRVMKLHQPHFGFNFFLLNEYTHEHIRFNQWQMVIQHSLINGLGPLMSVPVRYYFQWIYFKENLPFIF